MYTGVVLTIVALHAAGFLILLSHWLVACALFPRATESFAEIYERRALRATLVGIFTYGPLLLLLLNSAKIPNPIIRIVVIAIGFSALLIAFAGTAGLALRIGRNLCADGTVWQCGLRGGTMLALVFITPFLGWAFLLHVGLASGFGAFLLARPWRSKDDVPLGTPAPALS